MIRIKTNFCLRTNFTCNFHGKSRNFTLNDFCGHFEPRFRTRLAEVKRSKFFFPSLKTIHYRLFVANVCQSFDNRHPRLGFGTRRFSSILQYLWIDESAPKSSDNFKRECNSLGHSAITPGGIYT